MNNTIEIKCPECGQQLRVPSGIGGMLMACPSCGQKFHSDFKLAGARSSGQVNVVTSLFEMPYKALLRIVRYFK